jgi:hypothetical protein
MVLVEVLVPAGGVLAGRRGWEGCPVVPAGPGGGLVLIQAYGQVCAKGCRYADDAIAAAQRFTTVDQRAELIHIGPGMMDRRA